MCTHTYVLCLYVLVCIFSYICVYVYMCVCIDVRGYIWAHKYTHTRAHICILVTLSDGLA